MCAMNASTDAIRGSCLCGAVRFVVTAPFLSMSYCHCTMCRRQHGSAYATYCEAAAADFRVLTGAEAIVSFASSPGIERRFCGTCGGKLSFHAADLPDRLWIAAGALDDDPGIRPSYHIFAASQAPWHEITDDLPRHAAYPE